MTKPAKIYASIIEDEALNQFNSAMQQQFVVAGALMPDAHTGYSLPIGAVIATKDVVVPAWVGYDIGCGMCAGKLDGIDVEEIRNNSKAIFDELYKQIPVGFNINQQALSYSLEGLTNKGQEIAASKNYDKALGSLGGGNHFIEIGMDERNAIWVVIHSGSRGVGHGIATNYMKLASPDGKAKEGHYGFDVESQNGRDYIQDLDWCLEFALANRLEIMSRVVSAVNAVLGTSVHTPDFSTLINRNHNHAVKQDGLWVHRKGATHAEKGMMGVIPGNMRDGSFIVRGLGNPESLCSSSHGAGRVLGRKEAKRQLDVAAFISTMHQIQAKVEADTLDESPFAYKDIFDVMRLQSELVEVVTHITPLINIKG